MSLTVRLKRLEREATSLLLLLLLLEDSGEFTDKAVLAEVPSSSSTSSTAARFLPRPLVCLDAAAVVAFFFRVDIAGAEEMIQIKRTKIFRSQDSKIHCDLIFLVHQTRKQLMSSHPIEFNIGIEKSRWGCGEHAEGAWAAYAPPSSPR